MKRAAIIAGVALAAILIPAASASAHPLGNFTVNRYAGIQIASDAVRVHYVVDMAEIPTYQERDRIDVNRNGTLSKDETRAYAADACAGIARNVHIAVSDRTLAVEPTVSALVFVPGAAGLPTLRLECELASIKAKALSGTLTYRDENDLGRVGWREVTAVGDGTTLTSSSVPTTSVSNELRNYPEDLLTSPLDVREARLSFKPGGAAFRAEPAGGVPSLVPRGVDQITRAFTSFLGRQHLSVPFAALAVLFAIALGAVHALAPGHGKTVMAAYLVGQKGSIAQGALIGLTVTATHTLGVLVLGIAVSASATIAPERIYPLLGIGSGAMLGIVGALFLRRALHHRHHHEHPSGDDRVTVGRGGLIGIGFAGGLVPSPSALVVLLGAIALKRLWFGVGLVVAYGIGMALTLCGAGLLLVRIRARLERRAHRTTTPVLSRLARAVPVLTAIIITSAGVILAVRGVSQI